MGDDPAGPRGQSRGRGRGEGIGRVLGTVGLGSTCPGAQGAPAGLGLELGPGAPPPGGTLARPSPRGAARAPPAADPASDCDPCPGPAGGPRGRTRSPAPRSRPARAEDLGARGRQVALWDRPARLGSRDSAGSCPLHLPRRTSALPGPLSKRGTWKSEVGVNCGPPLSFWAQAETLP